MTPRFEVAAPVWVPSKGKIVLFANYLYKIGILDFT